MGLGYFQLTAENDEDKYLIGNPEFTYFKSSYKRHTNFAKENVLLNFSGDTFIQGNFSKKMYVDIPKNGDLVHKMYLVINTKFNGKIEDLKTTIGKSGFSLIDYIEISIGDQIIDKHTGDWLHIYHELFIDDVKNNILCDMIDLHNNTNTADDNSSNKNIYIPLTFWFNKNPGQALPILALVNNNVRINIKFKNTENIFMDLNKSKSFSINQVKLLTEYIHLDIEEKRLFASTTHNYLIEQVQYSDNNNVPLKLEEFESDNDYKQYLHKFDIPFKHCIKELLWVIQDKNYIKDDVIINNSGNNIYNYWFNLDREK